VKEVAIPGVQTTEFYRDCLLKNHSHIFPYQLFMLLFKYCASNYTT
jgi:hypothetical protein